VRRLGFFGVAALLAVLASTGCTSLRVEFDPDRSRDFVDLHRFSFAPGPDLRPSAGQADVAERQRNRDVALQGLRQELEKKGYEHDSVKPDYIVHFWLGRSSGDAFQPYEGQAARGELDVWFSRPGKNDRFWSGWAYVSLYGRIDAEQEVRKAVELLVADVPAR
jgi:hypothetical protein